MKRHRFDVLSFSFGLVYALLGVIFLIPSTPFDLVEFAVASLRWIWPGVILLIGAAILVPLVRRRPEED